MPIRNFPIQAAGPFSVPSPVLPIVIRNPANNFPFQTWALIDTGADRTAIPGFIARRLGHEIGQGKYSCGCTASGNADVYAHTCRIDILGIDNKGEPNNKTIITIPDRPIDVIENLHCVLLGVSDFLCDYVLEIDYPAKVFSIRRK